MTDSPFGTRSTITLRSPLLSDKSPKTVVSTDEKENLKKRKLDEMNTENEMEIESSNNEIKNQITIQDVYDLIKRKSAEDSCERMSIKNEIKNEIKQINEKIVSIEQNINKIEERVDAVALLAQQNKKIINSLCQEKWIISWKSMVFKNRSLMSVKT